MPSDGYSVDYLLRASDGHSALPSWRLQLIGLRLKSGDLSNH